MSENQKVGDQLFQCQDCFQTFWAPVWHCPFCHHHYHDNDEDCHNCHNIRPSSAVTAIPVKELCQ